MRIAFLGHSYHGTTRSNDFFLELLRRLGEVEVHYDESWLTSSSPEWLAGLRPHDFDCVVVYQLPKLLERLDLRHPNVVFVPMLDNHYNSEHFWWEEGFSRTKVLCFSATLHRLISGLAPRRHFAQYSPPLSGLPALTDPARLSAFFWYRQPPIDLALLGALAGSTVFDRFTLQRAPDPGASDLADLASAPRAQVTERAQPWMPVRGSYLARLAEHTVYFAPRLYEGIGMGFLEAMALGLCVVAPDTPTHNEYISHGATGLLYSPERPLPLDFRDFAELGRRARESAELRRALWERAEADLLDFLATPIDRLKRASRLCDYWAHEPALEDAGVPPGARPLSSITVVVLRTDVADDLAATLASVREQDHPTLAVHVQDPRDERLGADYAAMTHALAEVKSEFVLFLRAGDRLVSPGALRQLLHHGEPEADVVYGHFISADRQGVEELCLVAEFGSNLARLDTSGFDPRWMRRAPCLQATAFRVSRLRQFAFDPELRFAADFDLHRRLARAGARHAFVDAVVALCGPDGSWSRFFPFCSPEWLRIAVRHGRSRAVRRAFVGLGVERTEAWEWTLRGWLDRLWRRGRRRFGGASPQGERPSAMRRVLDSLLPAMARGCATVERLLARSGFVKPLAPHSEIAGADAVYAAEFADGIDFRRPGRPRFVARLAGISWREEWGRWTDGPRVEIEFHRALPLRTRVVLEAFAFERIAGATVKIAIGAATAQLQVAAAPFQTYSVDLETSGRDDTLSLAIPLPASSPTPKDATPTDPRRLGLALRRLQILDTRGSRGGAATGLRP